MSIATLNFKDTTIPEQVVKTKNIIKHTENNSDFQNPIPTLADIAASNDLLESTCLKAMGKVHLQKQMDFLIINY